MVRLQDYEQFVAESRQKRWKGPWFDFELKHPVKKPKKKPRRQRPGKKPSHAGSRR